MATDASRDIHSGANGAFHVLNERCADKQRRQGRVARIRDDADVSVIAFGVRFLQVVRNLFNPGACRLSFSITLKDGSGAPVYDLLQIDAVNVDSWRISPIAILVVHEELVKVVEACRQAPMAINGRYLQQAGLEAGLLAGASDLIQHDLAL